MKRLGISFGEGPVVSYLSFSLILSNVFLPSPRGHVKRIRSFSLEKCYCSPYNMFACSFITKQTAL